ncbi:MAG: DUF4160 domain-containing protein [Nitrospirota bacterium]
MPEIARFFGIIIIIRMFYDDHNPPHFHAEFRHSRRFSYLLATQLVANQIQSIERPLTKRSSGDTRRNLK